MIIKVDVKVAGGDEFIKCASAAKERKELNSSRKTEKGLEKVLDRGGRYILNIDIFE